MLFPWQQNYSDRQEHEQRILDLEQSLLLTKRRLQKEEEDSRVSSQQIAEVGVRGGVRGGVIQIAEISVILTMR